MALMGHSQFDRALGRTEPSRMVSLIQITRGKGAHEVQESTRGTEYQGHQDELR